MFLKLNNIVQSFGGIRAIDRLDLSVEEGQICGLIGPNGSGKSTTFNCISRYYTPDQGEISFRGNDLLRYKPHQVLSQGISRTFQNLELFENMSVFENLMTGQHTHFSIPLIGCAFNLPVLRRQELEARSKVDEVLSLLELLRFKNTMVSTLPLGVRRRVELARALVSDPQLLLLDEPAAGLNAAEMENMIQLLRTLNEQLKITILLVEHNMNVVMAVCQKIVVMNFGKKITEGSPEEIKQHPEVIAAYLGEGDDAEN